MEPFMHVFDLSLVMSEIFKGFWGVTQWWLNGWVFRHDVTWFFTNAIVRNHHFDNNSLTFPAKMKSLNQLFSYISKVAYWWLRVGDCEMIDCKKCYKKILRADANKYSLR